MASDEHKTRLKEAAARLDRVNDSVGYLDREGDGMSEEAAERFARELHLIAEMLKSVNDTY